MLHNVKYSTQTAWKMRLEDVSFLTYIHNSYYFETFIK